MEKQQLEEEEKLSKSLSPMPMLSMQHRVRLAQDWIELHRFVFEGAKM
jgi:hypothetical protein